MHQNADSINGIASWLQVKLAAGVTTRAEFDSEVVVFRVQPVTGGAAMELAISEEALGDHPPDEVIADLAALDIPDRLRRDPTMRLAYSTDRDVPHLETRYVDCDGRRYRLVRDSQHAVRAYDQSDNLLPSLPSPLPILQVSLFRRGLTQLQDDIRQWRSASG
jgi:hypothetical protein